MQRRTSIESRLLFELNGPEGFHNGEAIFCTNQLQQTKSDDTNTYPDRAILLYCKNTSQWHQWQTYNVANSHSIIILAFILSPQSLQLGRVYHKQPLYSFSKSCGCQNDHSTPFLSEKSFPLQTGRQFQHANVWVAVAANHAWKCLHSC